MRGQSNIEYFLMVAGAVLLIVLAVAILRGNLSYSNERVVAQEKEGLTGSCNALAKVRGEAAASCPCDYANECLSKACSANRCA